LDPNVKAKERKAMAERRLDADFKAVERQRRAAARSNPDVRAHEQAQRKARRHAVTLADKERLDSLLAALESIDNGIPSGASQEVKNAIVREVQAALYADKWRVCAVCDELAPSVRLANRPRTHVLILPQELPNHALAGTLHVPQGKKYHEDLLAQYNVTDQFDDEGDKALLRPLALSPRGIVCADEATEPSATPYRLKKAPAEARPHLCVCSSCWTSLKSNKKKPPQ